MNLQRPPGNIVSWSKEISPRGLVMESNALIDALPLWALFPVIAVTL